MEDHNQDNPTELPVHPAPPIDASELFQKDPAPELVALTSPKNLFIRLGRKKVLLIGILLVVLTGGGIAFAQISNHTNGSAAQKKAANNNQTAASLSDDNTTTKDDAANQTASTSGSSTTSPTTTQSGSSSTTGTGTTSPTTGGTSTSPTAPSSGGGTTTPAPKTYDISYKSSCFSPADVTIKKGDTVRFTNNSSKNMWPASDNHPSHTIYPEFDSKKSIGQGGTYSFTFAKIGSWGYHDHLKPGCTGTITVQ